MTVHRNARHACRHVPSAVTRARRQRATARAGPADELRLMAELHDTVVQLRALVDELVVHRIELEQDLRAAEQQMWRYQMLFDTAPDAYVVTNAAGAIIEVNGMAQHLLQQDAHRLVGMPLGQLVRPADGCPFGAQLAEIVAGGVRDGWELQVLTTPRHHPRATASVSSARAVTGERELRWILRGMSSEPESAHA